MEFYIIKVITKDKKRIRKLSNEFSGEKLNLTTTNCKSNKMGCCCSKKNLQTETEEELPPQNQFQNREWVPKVIKKKERYALPAGVFNVKLSDDDKECLITGAAFLPNGDVFIVDQNNRKLKLFGPKFQLKTSLKLPSNPFSVCSVPQKPYVYITFPSSNRVRKVECTKNDMKRTDTFHTVGKCTAICSNKFSGLATAVNVLGNQWQIQLLNSSGEVQKCVHGEGLFLDPEHMAITRDLNLVISDKGNDTLYYITPNGYVIFAYAENLRSPLDVFTDKKGYIYVGTPERIIQLNELGQKVQYLLSKVEIGFAPDCLAYKEKDETLIVAGRSDKVKVYKLK